MATDGHKAMVGTYADAKMSDCTMDIGEFCMCYTCLVWKYKGCPLGCTNGWACGEGKIVWMNGCATFSGPEELTQYGCFICPAKMTKVAKPVGAPSSEDMAR